MFVALDLLKGIKLRVAGLSCIFPFFLKKRPTKIHITPNHQCLINVTNNRSLYYSMIFKILLKKSKQSFVSKELCQSTAFCLL